nr:4534_t:CDS:2 [Entrophospora candida]
MQEACSTSLEIADLFEIESDNIDIIGLSETHLTNNEHRNYKYKIHQDCELFSYWNVRTKIPREAMVQTLLQTN